MAAALEIFNNMRAERCTPNVVTYNTLIDVYGKLGQWDRALGVIKLMRSEVSAYEGMRGLPLQGRTSRPAMQLHGASATAIPHWLRRVAASRFVLWPT